MKLYLDPTLKSFIETYQKDIKQLGYTIIEDYQEAEVIVSSNKDYFQDVINCGDLKFIQLISAGFDFLEIDELKERDIIISNARDVYSDGIAEFVVGRILSVLQNHDFLNENQELKKWNRDYSFKSMKDLNVGIIGAGSIGQQIAKRFKPFESNIIGYNTSGQQAIHFDVCYPLNELDQTLSKLDIVIIAIPLNDDTFHLINNERINHMKKDVILVNIARGSVIDEQALIKNLDQKFSAVILDVFEKEPLDERSPLWSHPKVRISAHVSFKDNYHNQYLQELILNNLKRYSQQQLVLNQL